MAEAGRRFCEKCGTEIRQTANFCPTCGAATQHPEQEASTQPSPPPPTPPPKQQPHWLTTRNIIIGFVVLIGLSIVMGVAGLLAIIGFLALGVSIVALIGMVVQHFRRQPTRPWGITAGVSFVVFIVALILMPSSSTTSSQQPAQQSSTAENTTSKEKTAPLRLSGSGSDTLIFTYNRAALITFVYEYKDETSIPGHFSLTLLDDQGKQLDLIANTVGSTQGSKAVRIPKAGDYTVNVQADRGSWTVESRG